MEKQQSLAKLCWIISFYPFFWKVQANNISFILFVENSYPLNNRQTLKNIAFLLILSDLLIYMEIWIVWKLSRERRESELKILIWEIKRNIRNFSECEQKKEDAILKYIFNSFILWLLLCDNKNDFNTTPTQQRKRVYFREAILKKLFHMMAKDSSKFFFYYYNGK